MTYEPPTPAETERASAAISRAWLRAQALAERQPTRERPIERRFVHPRRQ